MKKMEIAKKMLNENIPVEQISIITKLSLEKIIKIKKSS